MILKVSCRHIARKLHSCPNFNSAVGSGPNPRHSWFFVNRVRQQQNGPLPGFAPNGARFLSVRW